MVGMEGELVDVNVYFL